MKYRNFSDYIAAIKQSKYKKEGYSHLLIPNFHLFETNEMKFVISPKPETITCAKNNLRII